MLSFAAGARATSVFGVEENSPLRERDTLQKRHILRTASRQHDFICADWRARAMFCDVFKYHDLPLSYMNAGFCIQFLLFQAGFTKQGLTTEL